MVGKCTYELVPDSFAFYDYLGHNPAKGGLFRSGPMTRGDGIAVGWMGHPRFFTSYEVVLYARRVPSFFETFPIVLLDEEGIVRATQPFRRAEFFEALVIGKSARLLGSVAMMVDVEGLAGLCGGSCLENY